MRYPVLIKTTIAITRKEKPIDVEAAVKKERKRLFKLHMNYMEHYVPRLLQKGYIPVLISTTRRKGSEPLGFYLGPANAELVFHDPEEYQREQMERQRHWNMEPSPPEQTEFHYVDEDGRLCGCDGWPLFDENKNDIYADKNEYYSFFP